MQGGGQQMGGKGGMPGPMQSGQYGPELGRIGQPGGDQGGQYGGPSTLSAGPGITLGFGGQWWGDQMPQSPMGSFGGGPGQSTPGWGQQGQPPAATQMAAPAAAPAAATAAAGATAQAKPGGVGGYDTSYQAARQQLGAGWKQDDATVAANFDRLMKEDPFTARQYAEQNPQWYQQNQLQIKQKYFGNDAAKRNTWTNTNASGGYSARNINDPDVQKRLMSTLQGAR